MKFNPLTYKPINYRTWVLGNQAREGVNIKRLNILTSQELKLWEASKKYHDAREDPGHAEISTYFAIKLLPYYPKAIREIVVPTIMVHDDGWYGGDQRAWKRAVQEAQKAGDLKSLDSPEKRKAHQDKGAEMALERFKEVGYPPKRYWKGCARIIKYHDTRDDPRGEPPTPSGRAVWDSDYLYRVTLPCNQTYLFSVGITDPREVVKRAEDCCLNGEPPKNLEAVAQQIAKIELANTIFFKFPEQADEVLREKDYSKELEIVKRFYGK